MISAWDTLQHTDVFFFNFLLLSRSKKSKQCDRAVLEPGILMVDKAVNHILNKTQVPF